MLDHTSAMYLNVTPPYEDDASFFPDFYSRVGSCELQDPAWTKMNSLTAHKQKRKKSENKPQTQINKCNNEKRRREQENIYIEELAELISANFADMSSLSVKPDKCAILQETVNQIRRIKEQDIASHHNADPVQQGEVSSSRPTILSNDIYGPLLLEALEGFLFVINSEGKVEHVTENVSNYIKYTKEEIIGKAIYNFMHLGDHAKFHSNLLPMTIEWGGSTEQQQQQQQPARSKSIDVRLLVKADDLDETVEEKNQRVPFYELMHISSTQLRDNLTGVSPEGAGVDEDEDEEGATGGPCVLCVASRISHRDKASCYFEQFTTKLDTNGKIIGVDTSGVTTDSVAHALRKDLKGRALRDLVPHQDAAKVTQHLKETLGAGTSISAVYRIQIMPDKLVPVQTKSKFFKTNQGSDADFIMATHSIIGDSDTLDPGGGGIGGPLMTSVVNGASTSSSSTSSSSSSSLSRNGPTTVVTSDASAPPSTSSTSTGTAMQVQTAPAGAFTPEFLENDFPSLEFPSTPWDLETGWPTETTATTRPSSRQTVSTPGSRPPSNPSYSNAPTMVQSPLAHYSSQPSPVSQHQQGQQQSGASGGNFMQHFSVMDYQEQHQSVFGDEPKDAKPNVVKEEGSPHVGPQRLRILLTNPPTSSSNNSSGSNQSQQDDNNRDRILKELLNQKDDDHGMKSDSGKIGRLMNVRGPVQEAPKASSSSGNNMLRELLNDKNDDDDIETKAGMKKGSELLQELLKKKDNDDEEDRKNENAPHEDALLRTLGFPTVASNNNDVRRGAKRSIDDKDGGGGDQRHGGGKRNQTTGGSHHVSSSGGGGEKSELYQRNRMLALLLENPTPPPPSIPPLPASIISATPQEKLPRVIAGDPSKGLMSQNSGVRTVGSHSRYAAAGRQQNHFGNNNTHKPVTSFYPSSTSSNENHHHHHLWSDNNNIQGPSDPALSALLDDVIDFVPDHIILPILESHEHFGQANNQAANQMISEKNAIKNIQKILMQCEKSVPNVSLPARPPAYSVANISSGQQNNMNYPHPPPNYPQGKYPRPLSGGRGSAQFANSNLTVQQQQLLEQQRKMQQQRQAEEQKRRLLQLQERQQLLIPSNATAAELNSIQNIDNLLNNTVAPNVTLQRSNSVPQESQLSPGYTNQMGQQRNQQQSGQQQQQPPFSPQMPSPNFQQQQQQQQRMSPQQSQFSAQLSPRLSFQGEQQQQQNQANNNWPPQQQRLTAQNPMLNAQLTGNLPRGANFQRSPVQQSNQQRSLRSPGGGGGAAARHSPFNEQQFASPSSPNATFSQTQFLQRLQRANSVPTSNPQLTGGSPRLYHGNNGPLSYPPHQSAPPSPMMYPPPLHPHQQQQQDSSPFGSSSSYSDQQPQMGGGGYERRGSAPSQTGVSTGNAGNPTSEFVRQELRAVVGARTAQGAGPRGGGAPPTSDSPAAPQLQQLAQQGNVDLEALGISFEMPPGASGESPKMWGPIGSEMASVSPQPPQAASRTIMEEGRQGDHHSKTSLLQQLLSDQSK